jgi:chemotaxis protein methyltransferase CheR
MIELGDQEFTRFQAFIYEAAGISLSDSKKVLVSGRLEKRLRHHRLDSYSDYLHLISLPAQAQERQVAIDQLTTNETYFFREPRHFELLREWALAARDAGRGLRVWSAACSSGEEPYSIAMVLADCLGESRPWEIVASDISSRVLQRARFGHYPQERTTHIPPAYLQRFCLRGTGEQAGTLLVQRALRQRVQFTHINLDQTLPPQVAFDVIFLRNVMIYFSTDTKRRVVSRLVGQLKPGGHLLIGHSETLNDVSTQVRPLMPSVYRKP